MAKRSNRGAKKGRHKSETPPGGGPVGKKGKVRDESKSRSTPTKTTLPEGKKTATKKAGDIEKGWGVWKKGKKRAGEKSDDR